MNDLLVDDLLRLVLRLAVFALQAAFWLLVLGATAAFWLLVIGVRGLLYGADLIAAHPGFTAVLAVAGLLVWASVAVAS